MPFAWFSDGLELGLISSASGRLISVTIELQNFIAVVLGQDGAHLDVGDTHSASVLLLQARQILIS